MTPLSRLNKVQINEILRRRIHRPITALSHREIHDRITVTLRLGKAFDKSPMPPFWHAFFRRSK